MFYFFDFFFCFAYIDQITQDNRKKLAFFFILGDLNDLIIIITITISPGLHAVKNKQTNKQTVVYYV